MPKVRPNLLPAGVGTAADVLEDMLAKGLGQAYGASQRLGSDKVSLAVQRTLSGGKQHGSQLAG